MLAKSGGKGPTKLTNDEGTWNAVSVSRDQQELDPKAKS
jgi:hypothetical protein